MILTRSKPASSEGSRKFASSKEIPTLEEFLDKRDYTGAFTLLEFNKESTSSLRTDLWIGYCAFHLGDYKKAADVYETLKNVEPTPVDVLRNLACCYFYLGMYPEAESVLKDAPNDATKTRLLLHLAYKTNNQKRYDECLKQLTDSVEDQLSLASIFYLKAQYTEAMDIYKKVLANNRDFLALHVYQALCYYKLEFYDTTEEVLQVYLQQHPNSAMAINLKACNNFRAYDTVSAQAEMKQLLEKTSSACSFGNDLVQHNIVVFRGGEGALQVWPNLIDVIPEARLNLVIYYLKHKDTNEAYNLMKDLEASVPQEYILKAIIHAIIGQDRNSQFQADNIKIAEEYFHMVGSSEAQVDTIPGRQCMASSFFLNYQFDKVLLYLKTIKSYFSKDDVFNFNYAQAQAAVGHYKEAEEAFLLIQNERYKNDYTYISVLSYCYITNGKGQLAWDLYLKMDTSAESINLLQLIANVCYKVGDFWYAAKAFDMLDRMDPTPEYWEGKRGACCATFQYIVAQKLPKELLSEVIQLVKNTRNTQAEQIVRVMRKWAKENKVSF